MTKRDLFLDNLCAVLLLHMIFVVHIGYSCGGYDNAYENISTLFFSFFMAWFFFKGGITHMIESNKTLVHKSAKRLLVPYAICFAAGFLIDILISRFCWREGLFSSAFVNREWSAFVFTCTPLSTRAIWFLPSLFFARIIFNATVRHTKPWLIICCALVAGFLMDYLSIPCCVGSVFHGIALYTLGYIFRNHNYGKTLLCVCLFLFVAKFLLPARINFGSNQYEFSYLLAVVYEMADCILFTFIFMKVFDRKIPVITTIGHDSMVYYLVHYPVMIVAICIFSAEGITLHYWPLFFIVLSALAILYCLKALIQK